MRAGSTPIRLLAACLLCALAAAQPQPAEAILRQAIRLAESGQLDGAEKLLIPLTSNSGPPAIAHAAAIHNLASLRVRQGDSPSARRLYLLAVAEWEALRSDAPAPRLDEALGSTLNNLASLYSGLGQFSRAEALFRRSLELRIAVHGPSSPAAANVLNNLAVQLEGIGQLEESREALERARAILESNPAALPESRAAVLHNLAHHAELAKHYSEAEALYRRSLQLLPTLEPSRARIAIGLARTLIHLRQLEEAETILDSAGVTIENAYGPAHLFLAPALEARAQLYRKSKRVTAAKALERRARDIQAESQSAFARHSVDWRSLKNR